MKPIKLILIIAFTVGLVQSAVAKKPHDKRSLSKSSNIDHDTFIDANNLLMFVTNEGSFGWNLITGGGGLEYPKGTGKSAIFASGLWVGGKVDGETRVTVAEYSFEYQPGVILSDGKPEETDENRHPKNRVYKITSKSGPGDKDWDEWPVADGAPLDADGTTPLLLGDQALWTVYNDADAAKHNNMASDPLGIEVQHYTWAYNRQGALSVMLFFELTVINKGSDTIEETYLTLWSDPDLGQFDDDLVGSDTTLGLGYCYNSSNNDAEYGSAPPAVGYDFLQGPVVPSPGDTARVFDPTTLSFREILNHKNIPMVAFNKYINGADPSVPAQAYAFMIGKNRDGTDIFDPDGNLTTFVLAGDPVTGEGWLDANPADRRFLMSAGPFTMAPGDTQKIVAAIIIGQGSDRLSSITALKANDLVAQETFDNSFQLPSTPPKPEVNVSTYSGKIVLEWDNAADFFVTPDVGKTLPTDDAYHFEGFNVYQGESIAGPWKKIATYDVVNAVTTIRDDIFNPDIGTTESVVVQNGTDSGLRHYYVATSDAITGGALFDGSTYYFAVTAYTYNPNGDLGLAIESSIEPIDNGIVLAPRFIGTVYDTTEYEAAIVISVDAGDWDGEVGSFSVSEVVNPAALSDANYEILFTDPDAGKPDIFLGESMTAMTIVNTTTSDTVVNAHVGDRGSVYVDGVLISFDKRTRFFIMGIDAVNSSFTDLRVLDSLGFEWNGTIKGGFGGFFIGVGENLWNIPDIYSHDIEIRFDFDDAANQQYGRELNKITPDVYDSVFALPFTVWDAETNKQLYAEIFSDAEDLYSWETTDYIVVTYLSPGDTVVFPSSTGDQTVVLDLSDPTTIPLANDIPKAGILSNSLTGEDVEVFKDMYTWFFQFNSSTDRYTIGTGDMLRLTTPEIIEPGDVLTFSLTNATTMSDEVAKSELEKILVVPNPYYAHSSYETNVLLTRIVKFTHMPETATIRIFNLAGDLVRRIEHNNTTGFEVWNLKNSSEIFVASGIYIYHIDAGNLGTVVGKMAVFIEEERLQLF